MGFIFAHAGWDKLQHVERIILQYDEIGIPFPLFTAHFVGYLELIAGILLIIGLFTRVAIFPLILIEVIAIFTVKRNLIYNCLDVIRLSEFLYILLFTWLLIKGPESVSADHFLAKKFARK